MHKNEVDERVQILAKPKSCLVTIYPESPHATYNWINISSSKSMYKQCKPRSHITRMLTKGGPHKQEWPGRSLGLPMA